MSYKKKRKRLKILFRFFNLNVLTLNLYQDLLIVLTKEKSYRDFYPLHSQSCHHYCFYGMEAVFGFVENNGHIRFENIFGYFHGF